MELAVAVRIASEFTGKVQLSVFPYLLEKLLYTRHDPAAELPELSRLIKMDPALCFMALHLDRAVGPNVPPAETLDIDAVVKRIGTTGIDAITTQSAADLALKGIHRQQGVALEWLWRHGLATALLSRELARELDVLPLEEAYIAGLLHDIGKQALFLRTPASCAPMLADPAQAEALLAAEAQVVGSDHGRIGAWLIRRHTGAWPAADAAEYITADAAAIKNALPLTRLVWAASRLAAAAPQPAPERIRTTSALLEMDPQRLRRLADSVATQVSAVADELNLVPGLKESDRWCDDRSTPLTLTVNASAVLSNVYGELLTADDHDAIMRVLQRSLSVFLGIDTLLVMDHDPDGDRLIGRFAAGRAFPLPVNRLQIPLAAADCLPVTCHATGKAVASFSQGRQKETTIIDHQLMAYADKDGIICVPFRSEVGNGKSCLTLGVDRSAWPEVEQQRPLLAAIADAVGASLERVGRRKAQSDGEMAGRMASGIARTRRIVHEINNPLGIIKNYLKVLTVRSGDNTSGKEELRIINEEINRVAELIKSLTSPSTPTSLDLEPVDVNAVITDMLGLFRDSLPATAAIRLNPDLDEGVPMIASNRDRLKQVLMNLLKNAMEAMPAGGTIQVRSRLLSSAGRPVSRADSARYIKISVCDDGPGVDEGIKNDLFNPHVTSKTGHDGLGLAIVHEAVKHLKGSLLCESVPGRGTCFHIELPTGSDES